MPEYPITDWSGDGWGLWPRQNGPGAGRRCSGTADSGAAAGYYGRGRTGLGRAAMLRHSRQRWRLWIMAAAERVWGRE